MPWGIGLDRANLFSKVRPPEVRENRGRGHWNRLDEERPAEERCGAEAGLQDKPAGRRHEGGVEPLALSCSTDLKSAPRTDEDHPDLNCGTSTGGKAAVTLSYEKHRC